MNDDTTNAAMVAAFGFDRNDVNVWTKGRLRALDPDMTEEKLTELVQCAARSSRHMARARRMFVDREARKPADAQVIRRAA